MTNERTFLKCAKCGNIVGMIHNSGVPMICCGQPMQALTVNTSEASQEKHLPECILNISALTVTVGSAAHPMTEEHHIAWILVAQGPRTQRVTLEHTADPKAHFVVEPGPFTVYAYCNLHGLWATEV